MPDTHHQRGIPTPGTLLLRETRTPTESAIPTLRELHPLEIPTPVPQQTTTEATHTDAVPRLLVTLTTAGPHLPLTRTQLTSQPQRHLQALTPTPLAQSLVATIKHLDQDSSFFANENAAK